MGAVATSKGRRRRGVRERERESRELGVAREAN